LNKTTVSIVHLSFLSPCCVKYGRAGTEKNETAE
jgi:hypothetical protein